MGSLVENNRWAWSRLRAVVLRRAAMQCQLRLPNVCTQWAEEVDHIVPRVAGGTDHLDNLRAVCKACHRQRMRNAISGDASPAVTRHPFGGGPTIFNRPRRIGRC